jgi:carboxylate-amine ligase
MRPSLAHPTLELRASDSCTRVEDSIAMAALFRVLARRLYREPRLNADLGPVGRAIAVENKWRAQRYGVRGTFVGADGAITITEMIEQVFEETEADAAALGCTAELERCRTIADAGTSADAQLALYAAHAARHGHAAALDAVIRWLAATTLGDVMREGAWARELEPLPACGERSARDSATGEGAASRV